MRNKRIHDVARELGLHENTIRRLEARGLIHPLRNLVGHRIFDERTIQNIRDLYMNRLGTGHGATS